MSFSSYHWSSSSTGKFWWWCIVILGRISTVIMMVLQAWNMHSLVPVQQQKYKMFVLLCWFSWASGNFLWVSLLFADILWKGPFFKDMLFNEWRNDCRYCPYCQARCRKYEEQTDLREHDDEWVQVKAFLFSDFLVSVPRSTTSQLSMIISTCSSDLLRHHYHHWLNNCWLLQSGFEWRWVLPLGDLRSD